MMKGAYGGLRVLDLGQGVAAPYCAMLLAMHGALRSPPAREIALALAVRAG